MSIKSELRTITPSEALTLMTQVTHNRPIRPSVVDRLVAQLLAGRYEANGESIIFDDLDRLMDGQHRLSACAKSGIPITSIVVTGVPNETFATIDTGKARTAADTVAIELEDGLKLSAPIRSAIGSAINFIMSTDADGKLNSSLLGRSFGNANVVEFLDKHPDIIGDAVQLFDLASHKMPTPAGVTLAIFWMTKWGYPVDVVAFWTPVLSGAMLPPSSPQLLLHKKATKRPASTDYIRLVDKAAIIIKAWNMNTRGKKKCRTLYHNRLEHAYPCINLRPGHDPNKQGRNKKSQRSRKKFPSFLSDYESHYTDDVFQFESA